jgi:hypothetical protein
MGVAIRNRRQEIGKPNFHCERVKLHSCDLSKRGSTGGHFERADPCS